MPTIKLSHSVPAPVHDVFSFVADISGNASHFEDVLDATQLTEGPVDTGTRFEVVVKGMGKMDVEVTEYREPDRIVFFATSPRLNVGHEYRFISEGDRTRMDEVVDIQMKGITKIFAPFMGPMAKKGMRKATLELLRQFEK